MYISWLFSFMLQSKQIHYRNIAQWYFYGMVHSMVLKTFNNVCLLIDLFNAHINTNSTTIE